MAPRWGGLRPEPYDPDARDADNDGIVQEGTAWERPVGTQLLSNTGLAIVRGATNNQRPAGLRVVDANNRTVDYTPTYGTGPTSSPTSTPGRTPLADHGAGTLAERGLRNVRDVARPQPATPPAQPAVNKPKKLVGANGKALGYVPGRPDPNTTVGQKILQAQEQKRVAGDQAWRFTAVEYFEQLFEDPAVKKVFDDLGIDTQEFARGPFREAFDAHIRAEMEQAVQQPIIVAAPSGALAELFASGRYKSIFETGDVPGNEQYIARRRTEEQELMAVPLRIRPEARPVYGSFNRSKRTPDKQIPTYGDTGIELKDSVRARSTTTVFDSYRSGPARPVEGFKLEPGDGLDMAGRFDLVMAQGGDTADSNTALLNALRQAGATDAQIQVIRSTTQPAYGKIIWDYEAGEYLPSPYYEPTNFGDRTDAGGDYREVQIHGGFSVDDIAAIWVPNLAAVPPEIVDAAAKAGVPLKQADAPIPQRRLPDA